jgi:hypothetical protein
MGSNGIEQHAAETEAAVGRGDDDIEDEGFIDVIGENAREGHEAAGAGIAKGEDEVGMLDDAADIAKFPITGPPFIPVQAPKLLDVAGGEAADELDRRRGCRMNRW